MDKGARSLEPVWRVAWVWMGDTPDTLGPQEKALQHSTVFLAAITLLSRRELPADCGTSRTQPDQCKAIPLVLGILAYSKDSIFTVETKLVSVNYKMTKTQLRRYRRTNSRKENSCISALQELAIIWFTENQGRAVACTGRQRWSTAHHHSSWLASLPGDSL